MERLHVNYIRELIHRIRLGQSDRAIARDLNVERSTVSRSLPALEDEGRLLYEDRRGGLWPFRR